MKRFKQRMISRLLLPSAVRLATYAWGAGVASQTVQRDHVEGPVGLSVAMGVETVPYHLARGGRYGRRSTQVGEGALVTQALGVIPGDDR